MAKVSKIVPKHESKMLHTWGSTWTKMTHTCKYPSISLPDREERWRLYLSLSPVNESGREGTIGFSHEPRAEVEQECNFTRDHACVLLVYWLCIAYMACVLLVTRCVLLVISLYYQPMIAWFGKSHHLVRCCCGFAPSYVCQISHRKVEL